MHGLSFTVMDVWFNVIWWYPKWHWFVGHMIDFGAVWGNIVWAHLVSLKLQKNIAWAHLVSLKLQKNIVWALI